MNPPLQPCVFCGKPSGMDQLDPWAVPAGVHASLIVACAVCMTERHERRGVGAAILGKLQPTRPDGEPPVDTDPYAGRLSTLMVRRFERAWAVTAIDDGLVIGQAHGFATRGAAFDAGSRAITDTPERPAARALNEALHPSEAARELEKYRAGDRSFDVLHALAAAYARSMGGA